jgi:predicted aspartyl protease
MAKRTNYIDLELVSIDENGFHIMIDAKLGRKKIRLLVDTGASKTVFDKTRLKRLLGEEEVTFEAVEQLSTGLGTNSMESHLVTLKSLKIGEVKFLNYAVVVLDLSHVNESYKMIGDKGIDGVLGSDILMQHQAVIYYKTRQLKLYF